MPDIRLATDFFDHPKTMMLQARHGAEAVLCLQRLWCWAGNNRSKGILRGMDKAMIALVSKCDESLVDAFTEIGFLEVNARGYKLHNWKKHQGYVYHAEERSSKARKAALARHSAKSLKKSTCSEHTTSNARSNAPSPVPTPDPDPLPKPKKNNGTRFQKPSFQDVETYCIERGNSVDAQAFIDHYESNGWKVGKNAMKDWKAAVRTWERNGYGKGRKDNDAEWDRMIREVERAERRRNEGGQMDMPALPYIKDGY